MASSVNRRRLAVQAEREKALSKSAPNPTVTIEKMSLTALPVSSDDATATTPSLDASALKRTIGEREEVHSLLVTR